MFDSKMALAPESFANSFNRRSFSFPHDLHRHPIYDHDSLVDLVGRMAPSSAYWSTRPIAVDEGWIDQNSKTSLVQAVKNISSSDTLVVLKNIENDPVFGPAFQQAMAALPDLVGPQLRDDMVHGRATLLLTSPNRITGYHIDGESNFLFQLRGTKTVHVFDGSDRTLVPERELEAFYGGDLNGVRYRPERQNDATHYVFTPGLGIHVPIDWPHWVQNDNSVSVSISINYDLRSNQRRSKIYKINQKLRSLGVSPTSPGGSGWRDGGKLAVFHGLAGIRAAAQGIRRSHGVFNRPRAAR